LPVQKHSQSIQRGQIWNVQFNPQVGSELGSLHPAVVMNISHVGRLPLYIVVPITTGNITFHGMRWMMPITADSTNNLDHDCFADAFQVKSIAVQRFTLYRGVLGQKEMDELATIIAYCVGYTPPKPSPSSP